MKDLKEMCNMDAVAQFRAEALNPEHPKTRGSHENGDIFFQHREACNTAYNALPAVVKKYMDKINAKIGTNYDLFNYYGAEDADRVIIAMGSICDVAEEVIDYLTAKGEKVGLVLVRLYRPWVSEALLKVLPKTVKKIAVLDRTKEPGSLGEPLYLDVAATLREGRPQRHRADRRPLRPGQQGHPAELRVRCVQGTREGRPEGSLHHRHHRRRDQPEPARDQARAHHRGPRHQGVQVLGSGRRRHRRREQELHQDHRRPHRQVHPGLLPV